MTTIFPNIRHLIFLFMLIPIFVSCDENKPEENLKINWESFIGNYSGEFTYEMRSDSTYYWFVVDRNASLKQINPDKFKLSFQDTLYNYVAYYQTNKYPFLDTMFYKPILLKSLELDFIILEHFIESEQGSINGVLTLVTKHFHETSALHGYEYPNDSEKNQSIHLILEKELPIGADLPDSVEAITFHSFR